MKVTDRSPSSPLPRSVIQALLHAALDKIWRHLLRPLGEEPNPTDACADTSHPSMDRRSRS